MDPNNGSEEYFFSGKRYALLQRIHTVVCTSFADEYLTFPLPTLYLRSRLCLRFLLKCQLGREWLWRDRTSLQQSSWREGDGMFFGVFEQCRAPLPHWRAHGRGFREIRTRGKLVVHGCIGGGGLKHPRSAPDFLLHVKNQLRQTGGD